MRSRKTLTMAVLAAVLSAAIIGAAQRAIAAGPIQNGGFETATNYLPDFWEAKKLKLNATVDGQDCTTFSEGACSMRFKSDGNGSKLIQTLSSGSAGESYLLTFDTSSQNAGGDGRYAVWIKVYYNDSSKEKFQLSLPQGTHGWTSYQMLFNTAKSYGRIEIHIRYSLTRGKAWFDNFVLIQQ
jgi:hypothetical protein